MKHRTGSSRFGWCAFVMMALIMSGRLSAAEVTATVDRYKVVEGETITLVLQTSDPQQKLNGDLSGLEQDFVILDQRSESRMTLVNGQQAATIKLVITLEPKRVGKVVIPAIVLPEARTQAIPIEVSKAPELAPGEMPPVFIELELEPQSDPYYVLAQMALTVRIFYQQNLTEATISPPAPELASVLLLDEVPYQSTRNDTRYRVLERRYAIFPERSGELIVPPMTLSGRLIERPSDRLWQPQARGRRVRVESDPLTIQVQPRPSQYPDAPWLPARRITAAQQISDADNLEVGQPVTRTIIIDAVGLDENMIEEPVWPEMPEARIYPDQPQGIRRDDGQWVLGHKEFRYAVVPEQAGELVLPELTLQWWDTVNDQLRSAVVPEHRIAVAASSVTNDILAPLTPSQVGADLPVRHGADSANADRWRWAAIILGTLWALTLVMYVRKGGNAPSTEPDQGLPAEEAQLLALFKKACVDNDPSRARSLLGTWVRRHGPQPAHGSVMGFARGLDDQALRDEIYAFDAASFSTEQGGSWDGQRFWAAFSGWHKHDPQDLPDPESAADLYAQAR